MRPRRILPLREPLYAPRAGPKSADLVPQLLELWNLAVLFFAFVFFCVFSCCPSRAKCCCGLGLRMVL